MEIAQRLEGCARHSSVHAAGVVISPVPLQELIPIAVSGKDEVTTQYVMSDLEKTGMLKMDFLALTALTVINDCLITIKQLLGQEINWADIALNDEKTMAVFAEGRTDAVFQFESSGMQEICRKLKPKGVEDLSALNALYRPGPLDGGMVEEFIQRHHGKKTVRYLVPEMKEILSNTFGILVYQEQIMQLAQKLAGYTLSEADLMRRAMGKKKREEMAVHEEKFVNGAVERGIKKEKAEKIFSLMDKFSDYGFPRSHSVAYAYLAFQTAYLKAHFPEHFYAAVLSSEAQDAAKVFKYSKELRSQGIKLLPPDVNESYSGFTPLTGAIRYGLAAIKGLGNQLLKQSLRHARLVLSNRSLISRNEWNRAPSTSGCSRVWSAPARLIHSNLKSAICTNGEARFTLPSIPHWHAHSARSVNGCRVRMDCLPSSQTKLDWSRSCRSVRKPWTHTELLANEKAALGFYITGHPLGDYVELLQSLKAAKSIELPGLASGSRICIGGIINDLQPRTTKKGRSVCTASSGRRSRRNQVCAVAGDLPEIFCAAAERIAGSGYRPARTQRRQSTIDDCRSGAESR